MLASREVSAGLISRLQLLGLCDGASACYYQKGYLQQMGNEADKGV